MHKPSVTLSCPANAHSSPGERIVEFSFPDLRDSAGCPVGGLISLRTLNDGTPLVDVYRTDGAIRVLAPAEQPGIVAVPVVALVRVKGRGVMALPPGRTSYPSSADTVALVTHHGTTYWAAPGDMRPATPADLAAYLPDERARGLECKRADCWCRWFNPLPA